MENNAVFVVTRGSEHLEKLLDTDREVLEFFVFDVVELGVQHEDEANFVLVFIDLFELEEFGS